MNSKIIRKSKYILTSIGLLASLNCIETKALVTHSLNYTTDPGDTGTLSGSITIDETSVTYGNNVSDGQTPSGLPDWVISLSLDWDPGSGEGTAGTFTKSDYTFMRFVAIDSSSVDYNSDLVPQFTKISFIGVTGDEPTGGSGFEMNMSGQEYQLTSTPGPLPLAGFGFLFAYKRKIKNLLNSSNKKQLDEIV